MSIPGENRDFLECHDGVCHYHVSLPECEKNVLILKNNNYSFTFFFSDYSTVIVIFFFILLATVITGISYGESNVKLESMLLVGMVTFVGNNLIYLLKSLIFAMN